MLSALPYGHAGIPVTRLSNGASARYVPGDFPAHVLLAPATLQPTEAGRVYRCPVRLSDGGSYGVEVVTGDMARESNDAMCAEIELPGGYLARAWRRIWVAAAAAGDASAGDIVLELVPPPGDGPATRYRVATGANRPRYARPWWRP